MKNKTENARRQKNCFFIVTSHHIKEKVELELGSARNTH